MGNSDDAEILGSYLEHKSFRVARQLPGVQQAAVAPFLLNVEGVCGGGWIEPTMTVEAFDAATHERVLRAEITTATGCPDEFLHDVADAVDKEWPRSAADLAFEPDGGAP